MSHWRWEQRDETALLTLHTGNRLGALTGWSRHSCPAGRRGCAMGRQGAERAQRAERAERAMRAERAIWAERAVGTESCPLAVKVLGTGVAGEEGMVWMAVVWLSVYVQWKEKTGVNCSTSASVCPAGAVGTVTYLWLCRESPLKGKMTTGL